MRIRILLGFLLVLVTLEACDRLGQTAPPPPGNDPRLVGIWRETERPLPAGAGAPQDPLLLGFFGDGTFKAVYQSHRFETYHDFWGEWQTTGEILRLTVTGGNALPRLRLYEGTYRYSSQELILLNINLSGDGTGPRTVFAWQGAAPADKIVP